MTLSRAYCDRGSDDWAEGTYLRLKDLWTGHLESFKRAWKHEINLATEYRVWTPNGFDSLDDMLHSFGSSVEEEAPTQLELLQRAWNEASKQARSEFLRELIHALPPRELGQHETTTTTTRLQLSRGPEVARPGEVQDVHGQAIANEAAAHQQ